MVEGPQCHRVAHAHRKTLQGHAFRAASPNKRFTDGAKAIDRKPLTRIEVHGKNLFYFFGTGADTAVMHIHFGMSGHFRTAPMPGPETTPTTRLRLENDALGIVAHLSAMTVQHGDIGFYEKQSAKIGHDPLREDADAEALWARVHASKKPIGLILMDQSMVGGVGNIYRAEILFKRGFQVGSILTVDPAEAKVLGPPWTRRYIYNHPLCGRCKGQVEVWDMAARTVYACPKCQPLVLGTELAPSRSQALKKATPHKKFKSACAPDAAPTAPPRQLTAAELREKLASLGQPTGGRKPELAARLAAAAAADASAQEATVTVPKAEAAAAAAAGAPSTPTTGDASTRPPKRRRPIAGAKGGFAAVLDTEDRMGEKVSAALERPGEPERDHWDALSVPMLKHELQRRRLPARGKKADLVARLRHGLGAEAGPAAPNAVKAEAAGPGGVKAEDGGIEVKPGTQALGPVATAQEAEAEKAAAGEGKNVEHVALQESGVQATRPARKRRARATAA